MLVLVSRFAQGSRVQGPNPNSSCSACGRRCTLDLHKTDAVTCCCQASTSFRFRSAGLLSTCLCAAPPHLFQEAYTRLLTTYHHYRQTITTHPTCGKHPRSNSLGPAPEQRTCTKRSIFQRFCVQCMQLKTSAMNRSLMQGRTHDHAAADAAKCSKHASLNTPRSCGLLSCT